MLRNLVSVSTQARFSCAEMWDIARVAARNAKASATWSIPETPILPSLSFTCDEAAALNASPLVASAVFSSLSFSSSSAFTFRLSASTLAASASILAASASTLAVSLPLGAEALSNSTRLASDCHCLEASRSFHCAKRSSANDSSNCVPTSLARRPTTVTLPRCRSTPLRHTSTPASHSAVWQVLIARLSASKVSSSCALKLLKSTSCSPCAAARHAGPRRLVLSRMWISFASSSRRRSSSSSATTALHFCSSSARGLSSGGRLIRSYKTNDSWKQVTRSSTALQEPAIAPELLHTSFSWVKKSRPGFSHSELCDSGRVRGQLDGRRA
mmetsp:Transcript_3088/g.6554  ORF Transcript_3088/g.6554 Transcript_3088/m.6554 type:complete len:328 (-) Transcript_3088:263-1246(-)